MDRLLTVEEVAEMLGYSAGTVYNKVSRKEIPVVRMGRTIRFRLSAIRDWLEAQETAAAA